MEVYAEITGKMLAQIESGTEWVLPAGVVLTRKHGSRACFFECEDKLAVSDLMDFLNDRNISWQLVVEEREGKKEKKDKKEKKSDSYAKDFKDFDDPWHKEEDE